MSAMTAPAGSDGLRGTPRQRLVASLVAGGSWLACRLPERPLVGLSAAAGELWYRVDRRRAGLVRRNLGRVAGWLAANDVGDPRARAAATNPVALERLVRSAFRQYARYYLDLARAPAYSPAYLAERIRIDEVEHIDEAFPTGRPAIFIGLHFGAIELMAYLGALHAGRTVVTPMETVGDPALQRYFVRTRGSIGIRIVGLREARRELTAALERGELVGLVADRDLTGGGMPATLFGSSLSLPLGPALLAVESGAPVWLTTMRRTHDDRLVARLEPIPVPAEGTRRERVTAYVEAVARAFEQRVAEAPDQWWAAFFPIWPDIAAEVAA